MHRASAWLSERMALAFERWLYGTRVSRFVAASDGVKNELLAAYPLASSGVDVIPNGVDLDRFVPDASARTRARQRFSLTDGELVAAFVGSEWGRKGLAQAIAGVALATGWKLVIDGSGDQAKYRGIAEALGVSERVMFAGKTPDVALTYQAADAFLFPSSYEAFPLVALEAAATGLPLLSTRTNGVTELLKDGISGWLLDGSPDDIAKGLARLGADESLRQRMGRASREAAKHYEWGQAVDLYVAIYRANGANRPHSNQPDGTAEYSSSA
jgi:UDP-glucose:(heptosyl)LPS alpha-1,3-glucosyltransferase